MRKLRLREVHQPAQGHTGQPGLAPALCSPPERAQLCTLGPAPGGLLQAHPQGLDSGATAPQTLGTPMRAPPGGESPGGLRSALWGPLVLLGVSNTSFEAVFQHLGASASPGHDIAVLDGSASVRSTHVFRYLSPLPLSKPTIPAG